MLDLRACLLVLVTLLLGSGWVRAEQYAVLVGVENYEHANLRTPLLKYPVEDVTELATLLRAAGYRVVLLTDETGAQNPDLKPTRANIDLQIETVLAKCQRADTVVLAFAGHGLQFEGTKDAYFCPLDAKPFAEKASTLISMKKVYGELESSFAGVKLIFVDACRNDPDPGRGRGGLDSDAAPPPKGVGALFSCSAGQKAFEHDSLKHGVFFHYVLEGLRREAHDNQGRVTFQGLSLYVQDHVPGKVSELFANREQSPNLRADLTGAPPVVLRKVAVTSPQPLVAPFSAAAAKAGQEAWAKYLGRNVVEKNSLGMDLVLLPPGTFRMGSTAAQIDAVLKFDSNAKREQFADEQPQHTVQLTKPFRLGATEVTVGQFRRFVTATGYQTEAEKDGEGGYGWNATTEQFEGRKPEYTWKNTGFAQTDNHPVVNVSWNDAQAFVEWLSRDEGLTYRLPTEAEWEYACRAGTTGLWWHGDDPEGLGTSGNVADGTGKARWGKNYANISYIAARDGDAFTATVVRSSRTNPFGLSDMHGNVLEWCGDWYDAEFYGKVSGTAVDPFNANPANLRVHRGGSWDLSARLTRSATRYRNTPDNRDNNYGFRVSRTE